MTKNTFLNNKIKIIKIKTTATTLIKHELKYFPMSKGNTYIAKPRGITLNIIQYRTSLVFFS